MRRGALVAAGVFWVLSSFGCITYGGVVDLVGGFILLALCFIVLGGGLLELCESRPEPTPPPPVVRRPEPPQPDPREVYLWRLAEHEDALRSQVEAKRYAVGQKKEAVRRLWRGGHGE